MQRRHFTVVESTTVLGGLLTVALLLYSDLTIVDVFDDTRTWDEVSWDIPFQATLSHLAVEELASQDSGVGEVHEV